MKKNKIIVLCSMASLIATSAYCADGPYISGNIGLAQMVDSTVDIKDAPLGSSEIDFDNGYLFTGSFGYRFSAARLEGELGYQQNDYNHMKGAFGPGDISGEASALSFMVNGYYDFFNNSNFSFFATAGIGLANVDFSDVTYSPGTRPPLNLDDSDTVLAWQVGAGVGYAFTEQFTMDFKYRYFDTDKSDFDMAKTEFASHNFILGARFNF